MHWLLRRLVASAALVVAVPTLTFVIADAAPGDPLARLHLDPAVSPETVIAVRARYDLDGSLPERYLAWLQAVGRGEMGFSVSRGAPAGRLLWPRAVATLLLTVSASAVAWILGLALGGVAAAAPGRIADRLLAGLTALLLAVPELVLALLLLAVAVRTGWLPTGGMTSLDAGGHGAAWRTADLLRHMALPVSALALGLLPVIARHVRSALGEALAAPFAAAARAHGVPPWRIVLRHGLPAAAGPLVSLLGLTVAGLVSGSLLVEVVLSWPGLGPLVLEAMLARDVHVVAGAVTLSGLMVAAGVLLTDLLLLAVDPRVRERR